MLAYCDQGCYDDAVDLLADVMNRLGGRRFDDHGRDGTSRSRGARDGSEATLDGYALRTASAALGQLHRRRRKSLGLPQRPERVIDTGWAGRILPDPGDRRLLAHMLTWLGSDAPAVTDAGWPVETWAPRYGLPVAAMAARVGRVADALREGDPRRYWRYIAEPLAAKPRVPALLGDIEMAHDDMAVHGEAGHGEAANEEAANEEALCAG